MTDERFDALLCAACDAAMPTLPEAPARAPIRRWLWAAVAAACLLAGTGVCAAWPKIRYEWQGGHVYTMIDNAPAEAESEPMEFTYLPEDYTLTWTEEDNHYWAYITYRAEAYTRTGRKTKVERCFAVQRSPLHEVMSVFGGPDGGTMTREDWEEIQEVMLTLDSLDDLTLEQLTEYKMIRWVTDRYMYRFYWTGADEWYADGATCMDAPEYPRAERWEEILRILQGITP